MESLKEVLEETIESLVGSLKCLEELVGCEGQANGEVEAEGSCVLERLVQRMKDARNRAHRVKAQLSRVEDLVHRGPSEKPATSGQ